MKKKLFILPVGLLCLTLSGCAKDNTVENYVWHAYSTENLLADMDYFDEDFFEETYSKRDKTLRFNCIKNENEGVQLMISAKEHINSYDFEVPDVVGDNGRITKNHFSVSAAYYMNIDYSNEKNALSGYYPDTLIPFDNFKFRRMNYINKGSNQALYINLKTNTNTPAGEYKGVGKLHLNNKVIDIPFEVTVFDAVMPNEVHQKAAFGLWYNQISYGERDNSGNQMDLTYYNFLVEKRISPRELPPSMTQDFDSYVKNFVEIVAFNDSITALRLPIDGFNFSKDNVREILQKLIDKNLEFRRQGNSVNFFDKLFFYIDDEPFPASYDLVRTHDKTFFDAKKALCGQLTSYPDLYKSFTEIPNVVTREFVNELVATNTQGGIQTWCPLISFFQSPDNREIYRQRQASTDRDFGEHVWWYTCCDPVSPYPNYHLDSNTMLARVAKYIEFDYGIEGQIFWSANYYSKYSRGETLTRDIWTDPISWQLCAGDGQFVYPGYTFGIYGPITTLRLENILASNEEYEYLWMIDQKVQEYNTIHSTNLVTNNLLNKYYSKLFTNVIIDTDSSNFESVRLELLKVVETLNKNLDNGISMLIK